MPYAAATDAAAGHPPVDVGTEASTPCCAASVTISGGENSSCASPISSTAPATRSCASPRTRSRLASTKWTDEGASVTSRPSRRTPSSCPQTWCTSSTTTHTPSGHRLPNSASSQAADTGRVVGARSMPADAAMRRRKCAGERSSGVAPTRMSVPRGANAFSAIIWESSTDLPNPGPPTSNTARRSQRAFISSTRRGRATRRTVIGCTPSITLRSDRPER